MIIPNESATRVFTALVNGRGTAKEAAIRILDSAGETFDREHLRSLIVKALTSDFQAPRSGQTQDLWSADTRCWLLSALGRVCTGDNHAERLVRQHLDPQHDSHKWARYWALEGLYVGQPDDLKFIATKLAASGDDPLIVLLATAILAGDGNINAIATVNAKLQGSEDEKWAMLRGLRVVPASDGGIVHSMCSLVQAGSYTDVTFDAIIALGRISSESRHAGEAARALAEYVEKYRWPMYEAMRTKALRGLGNLRVERTASVIVEELSDDSPAIVFEAGRALESVLGVKNATKRIVETAVAAAPETLAKLGNALRSMNRSTVVEELESAMLTGNDQQQEAARALLSEVGGLHAFQRLRARTNAINQYLEVMETAEANVRRLFEQSIDEARHGFRIAIAMDVLVFALGMLLIAFSAGLAMASDGDLKSWVGAGAAGTVGVLGVLYSLLIGNPRKQIQTAVDHLMHLKIVFLGYLRRLHQTDQAYTRRLLDDRPMEATEIGAYATMVGATMEAAILQMPRRDAAEAKKIEKAAGGAPAATPETA